MDLNLIVDRLQTELACPPGSAAIERLLAALKDRELSDRIRSAL